MSELVFRHIKTRMDRFESRYFDFQKSSKFLLQLDRKGTEIEMALYEHFSGGANTDIAIDISTMAGCPMKCIFCASSSISFQRALSASEMIAQADFIFRKFVQPSCPQITCSFQGVGEPSLVANEVISAAKGLLSLDSRVVLSLSSIGASQEGLQKIVKSGISFDNLQLTLCSTTNNDVRWIMPGALLPAEIVRISKEMTRSENLKKVKINYILLKGINDSQANLDYLIRAFKDTKVIIKISCLNETAGARAKGLCSGSREVANSFKNGLLQNGIDSFVFGAFGDIKYSCGQLSRLERS